MRAASAEALSRSILQQGHPRLLSAPWLKDRYGLSWQVIPGALGTMLHDKDPAKARRVAAAMMQMGKIDIEKLRQAYDGR